MKHKQQTTDDELTRRRFIKGGAGAVLAASLLPTLVLHGLGLPRRGQQAAAKKTYICPPCGQPCDKLTFDGPGPVPNVG
jgi:anaerobic selenocysteine-containing dehydrogenase